MSTKHRKICLDLIFSSPAGFARIPGSEPIHLDLEKLFLLSVSKENLDFRGEIEKNLPYKKINVLKYYFNVEKHPKLLTATSA